MYERNWIKMGEKLQNMNEKKNKVRRETRAKEQMDQKNK